MDLSYTPKEVSSLMGLVDTYLRHKAEVVEAGSRSYDHYHPSEWGKCLRMQQYKHYAWEGMLKVTPNHFDSRMLRLFGKGHNMHVRWTEYFGEIGVLKGFWRCQNQACKMFDDNGKPRVLTQDQICQMFAGNPRVYGTEEKFGVYEPEKCVCGCTKFEYEELAVVAPELNIYGHCDLIFDCTNLKADRFKGVRETFARKYLPQDGQVVVGDMKTIGSSAWKNQLERKGPHSYYLVQLTCYVHILGCDYGLLMYENKDNSEMKWYKVERNDEWWEDICWQAKTMQDMAKSTDANGKPAPKLPPPRPTAKSSYDCKNCDFKAICHASPVWDKPNLKDMRKQFYKRLL